MRGKGGVRARWHVAAWHVAHGGVAPGTCQAGPVGAVPRVEAYLLQQLLHCLLVGTVVGTVVGTDCLLGPRGARGFGSSGHRVGSGR